MAAEVRWRREVRPADAAAVGALVAATGFFTAAEAAVAVELVEERLARGPACGYEFLLAEDPQGRLLGYACYGPIPCTQASFDLYWIAVDPAIQGRGLGRALLAESEALIRQVGGRRVYIETSARGQYAATRGFYGAVGYAQAAFLEDFYAPGDGKVIYAKAL